MSEEVIRAKLAEVKISQADIRPIAPSLEDVFVALTNEHGNGAAKATMIDPTVR